jgi:hypothetical protein
MTYGDDVPWHPPIIVEARPCALGSGCVLSALPSHRHPGAPAISLCSRVWQAAGDTPPAQRSIIRKRQRECREVSASCDSSHSPEREIDADEIVEVPAGAVGHTVTDSFLASPTGYL